ncbi:SDR family oxidoreductase [Nakamurella sp. YIM 132087]|uniref:SDR family oxidoreductase n=1 Tax=Nakamurella alba TaxID=2665158 RepID=A0A7K1FQ99_9ACTN|nr:SDR family NAD(P)-dependent oxidoreductase [Nakamurella alba]MTD16311.1 SDR family oxidoreductase [Nakamurella alba]
MADTPVPALPARPDVGLRGEVAVVLGAGPGIGAATAALFAGAGMTVVCADVRADIARDTASAIGHGAVGVEIDVTARGSVAEAFRAVVADVGEPTVVVDVVGIAAAGHLADCDDATWDRMFALNLRQQYLVIQQCLVSMRRPGSYVAIASINGVVSSPYNAAYGAAKAGLVNLIRSAALEHATSGLRFNAIAPGIVATPRMATFMATSERAPEFSGAVPMGRLGEPDDIAGAALFLASPLASYVTGQVLSVDGGASVKYPLALMV